MNKRVLLTSLLVLPLTGCIYTQSFSKIVINGELVKDKADFDRNDFSYRGFKFDYVNVFDGEEHEFVFVSSGYIESVNNITRSYSLMGFNQSGHINVYGLNEEGEETLLEASNTDDYEYVYFISPYLSFSEVLGFQ